MFYDDVAAQHLIHVEIGHAALARLHAGGTAVLRRSPRIVEDLRQHRLADVAAMDAGGEFLVDVPRAGLEVHPIGELLFLRLLAAGQHALAARDVHRDGFGHVDMLAGVDGGQRLFRVVVRRSFDHHRVHRRLRQLTARIRPVIGPPRSDLERIRGGVEMSLDHVGERHHPRAGEFGEEGSDPVTASAAADQPDLDIGVRLRSEYRGWFQNEDTGGSGLQEIAAAALVLWHAVPPAE